MLDARHLHPERWRVAPDLSSGIRDRALQAIHSGICSAESGTSEENNHDSSYNIQLSPPYKQNSTIMPSGCNKTDNTGTTKSHNSINIMKNQADLRSEQDSVNSVHWLSVCLLQEAGSDTGHRLRWAALNPLINCHI